MTIRLLTGAASAALMLSAGTGWALTAQQAWETWQALAAETGQTIEAGAENADGGVLTVSDLTFALDLDDVALSGGLDEVVFTENGDGSVGMTMSDSYWLMVDGVNEEGEEVEAALTVAMPDLAITVTDTENGAVRFAYAAPKMTLTVDSVTVDGEEMPFDLVITATDSTGSYVGDSDSGEIDASIVAAQIAVDLNARDPETDGVFVMALTLANIATESSGAGSLMLGATDVPSMIEAGYATEGSISFGDTTFAIDFREGAEAFAMSGGLEGGEANVSLGADGFDYAFSYFGFGFSASGTEVPFPQITGAIGEWSMDLAFPLVAGDAVEPFVMRLKLAAIEVGEELWSMIDPAGAIPRDPATLVIDLAGDMRLLVDLTDEDAMMAAEAPGEIESVDIRELRLALAGAELTGEGGFTFDNDDLETFEGMPAPDGSVTLRLTGGNTLLDTLVKMGLVPEDQAMMGRMMTGMLAKPGPNPDELISEITVRPDGTIMANGAPLPF